MVNNKEVLKLAIFRTSLVNNRVYIKNILYALSKKVNVLWTRDSSAGACRL